MENGKRIRLPEIVPAILTDNEREFLNLTVAALKFAKRIQFDFMDSRFVPSISVPVDSVLSIPETTSALEAHLMVFNPERYFEVLKKANFEMIIFHVEAVKDLFETIKKIRSYGLLPGIAINPDTSVDLIESVYKEVEEILFMTVYPGYYGRPIVWEALDRAKEFKERHPEVIVGIDGGVKLNNVEKIVKSGVDRICVGSAIFKAPDIKKTYLEFISQVTLAAQKIHKNC